MENTFHNFTKKQISRYLVSFLSPTSSLLQSSTSQAPAQRAPQLQGLLCMPGAHGIMPSGANPMVKHMMMMIKHMMMALLSLLLHMGLLRERCTSLLLGKLASGSYKCCQSSAGEAALELHISSQVAPFPLGSWSANESKPPQTTHTIQPQTLSGCLREENPFSPVHFPSGLFIFHFLQDLPYEELKTFSMN